MTNYSIWPATDGPFSSSADDPVNLGIQFSVDSQAWIVGLRYFRGATDVNPDELRLWRADSPSVGTSLAAVTPPAAGTLGWQTVLLAEPVELTPSQIYKTVGHFPDHYVASAGYWTSGDGAAGITNGILTAQNNDGSLGGQGTFKYGASAYPDGTFNGGNYWVDVVVTDVDPSGGSEVTGTGVALLGALAAAASGVRSVSGAGVVTFGGLSATASGVRVVTATAVANLGGLSGSAVGGRIVVATASATLGGLIGSATGARTVLGGVNATLGVLAASIVGRVSLRGTGSSVLGRLIAAITVDAPAPSQPVAAGNWSTLLDIAREGAAWAAAEASRPPVACPNDGEPLERNRSGVLHCRFDGWTSY
ncbi:DUF4082 domain-containing protein [Lentzea sp. NPDC092896]|uniref:DUF4082 domain-containing protein n=1 Tax=Lentzea sp. NPDC092896 TaxID=3364127 RepID=UPI003822C733